MPRLLVAISILLATATAAFAEDIRVFVSNTTNASQYNPTAGPGYVVRPVPHVDLNAIWNPGNQSFTGGFRTSAKPALARKPVGKGQVWQAGFMLGLAYGAGSNKQENKGFATAFPEVYAKLLEPLFAAGRVSRPVTVNLPGIQTTFLETPLKKVIVLTDYTRDPEHGGLIEVTLFLPDCGKAKKVTSAANAKLTIVRKGANLLITVPLDIADIIVVEN